MNAIQDLSNVSVIAASTAGTVEAIRRIYNAFTSQDKISDLLRNELFPDPTHNFIVTTGRMSTIDSLDPEDEVAAVATLRAMRVGRSKGRRRGRLVSVDYFPEVGPESNVIAIGGPLSNRLNRSLAHVAPFKGAEKPAVPLYVRINPRVKQTVTRKFDGRAHVRPRWAVFDAQQNEPLYPQVDRDGWLTRDYLLFSCLPYTQSRVHISAFGLYGPGVMAVRSLVQDNKSVLREALEQRGRHTYFQSLFAVEKIEHRQYSVGKTLRHVVTYPIAIQDDKVWKLKTPLGNA